ncbi:MAG: dTDP-4-dehydrorhamnose 3,5-epimerase [Gammaproteobacteria bacterium]|jgi:dTDP-4-dehydrorhamnose 3,5-epimerase
MVLTQTPLSGAYVIALERLQDERGFFARSYCRDEFARAGLDVEFVQSNVSFNAYSATLRGMHFQTEPYPECKLVRCTMGAVYDVIVDIRPQSATRGDWFGVELSEENRVAVYVPGGFAHGFITLRDSSEVLYDMTEYYRPECACSLHWNDSDVGIDWPLQPRLVSSKDESASSLRGLLAA